MATKALTISYGADAKGVQSALADIDKSHANTTSKFAALSGSFGMLKGGLGELAAGFGPMGEAAEKAGSGIDHIKEKFSEMEGGAQKAGSVLVGAGAALTGIGALGVAIGEKQEQATKTLEVAVKNTGGTYEEYAKSIDKAVTAGEKNAHGAADTKEALAKLTTALGDTGKATDDMGLVDEVAAKKHISLSDAADVVLKIHQGAGKALKQFGIDAKAAGGAATELAAAQKADEAEVKIAEAANVAAAAAQEKLVTKYGLTAAGAKELAAAHAAVNAAMASGDPNKVLTAESALENQTYKLSAGLKMNQSDTDLLAKTRYDLGQKTAPLEAADTRLAKAQDAASKATAQGSFESQVMAKIHGTAAAQADTFGGRIAALKTHVTDLAGEFGAKLGPAITTAGPLIMGVGALMESNLIPQILTIGGEVVGTAAMWVSSWLSMAAGTVSAMIGIDISTGGLLLILAGLIAAVVLVWKNWDTIWGFVKDITTSAFNWIRDHLVYISLLFGPIGLIIYEFAHHWSDVWQGITAALNFAWGLIQPVVHFIGNILHDVIVVPAMAMVTVWSVVWSFMGKVVSDAWDFLKPIVTTIGGIIHWLVNTELEGLKAALGVLAAVWSVIWNGIQAVIQAVWKVVEPIVHAITQGVSDVAGAMKTIGSAAGSLGHFLGFQAGGPVPGPIGAPMLAVVHGGEYVSPLGSPGAGGAGGRGDVYVNVTVQGSVTSERNLTNTIYEGLLEFKRRQGALGLG
jgi:hypothetical protein